MIDKGFISSIDEANRTAVVVPMAAGSAVTHSLVIPYFLRDCLQINMPVAYATFEDNTGIILARMDGEWNHIIYDKVKIDGVTETTGSITSPGLDTTSGTSVIKGNISVQGNVTASGDVTAGGISLQGHKHGYTHGGTASGSDTTTPPQ